MFFFFNDTATTEIYTLSLHDALPIYTRLIGIITRRNLNSQLSKGDSSSIPEIIDILIRNGVIPNEGRSRESAEVITAMGERRSEEHTSELQSRQYLVCRLLLEKKKKQ